MVAITGIEPLRPPIAGRIRRFCFFILFFFFCQFVSPGCEKKSRNESSRKCQIAKEVVTVRVDRCDRTRLGFGPNSPSLISISLGVYCSPTTHQNTRTHMQLFARSKLSVGSNETQPQNRTLERKEKKEAQPNTWLEVTSVGTLLRLSY